MLMELKYEMQRSTLTFETYYLCLIGLNISSKNNDFGFHCIQKINFSKKDPI